MTHKIKKARQNTDITEFIAKASESAPISEISVARLIDDGLVALSREIKNLLILSARGKLEATDAKDLRDHLKLLFELKNRENESLRGLTDEELKAKVTEALSEDEDGNN